MNQSYAIAVSDFTCSACEHEVPCDTGYFSAVSFQEDVFLRKNYCEPCWKPKADQAFAFWRTRRPPVVSDKPKRVRFDTALIFEFFRRLDDSTAWTSAANPAHGAGDLAHGAGDLAHGAGDEPGTTVESPSGGEKEQLRFVLALLLVRKKALQFVNSYHVDGRECLKLVEKGSQVVHWVHNPELDDEQLERVKGKIGDLLQMQL
jgi:hypothetical protein